MSFLSIFHTAFIFWIVLDAVGNIPLFISTLKSYDAKAQRKIIWREMFIALGVMIFFLFFGEALFELLKIKKTSLEMAGGIILFLIAIKMVFAVPHKEDDKAPKVKDPLIVPLAIPATAGPGILTMISIYGGGLESSKLTVLIAIILAWLFSVPIILCSSLFKKYLGANGLVAVERLFGYLIVLISSQVTLNGFCTAFDCFR